LPSDQSSRPAKSGISAKATDMTESLSNNSGAPRGAGKRVLVTGSAGFIGGYLVQELLDQGYSVVGLDNLSKYGEVTRSFDADSDYRFVEGDARDTSLVRELLTGCDHMIAGAALIGGISYFHTYAYDLLATNERIIASTCDAAIDAHKNDKLERVTYISSSMVFESTDRWPSIEGDERAVAPPLSSYGFQKLAVEYFARAAHDQYGLPYTIVRPFNCVGIGERRALGDESIQSGNVELAMSHVVPDLVQKLVKGQDPLVLLGDGSQIRHYTYGGDLARGIVLAMDHPESLNNDFNLSTATSTSVVELAEQIWKRIRPDQDFRWEQSPAFEHDVARRIPDVEKARKLLDFEATTDLDEMLDEVIPWIEQAVIDGVI